MSTKVLFSGCRNTLLCIGVSRQTRLETEEAVSSVSRFYLETMADRRVQTVSNQINNEFIRDVMNRADQMMYECKSELKSMGAKTRDM